MRRKSSTPKRVSQENDPQNPEEKSQQKKRKPSRSKKLIVIGKTQSTCSGKLFREMRRLQSGTALLIPRRPFSRLVREILSQFMEGGLMQCVALEVLQEATEHYLIGLLGLCQNCAFHARRQTIYPRDMHLVQDIKGH